MLFSSYRNRQDQRTKYFQTEPFKWWFVPVEFRRKFANLNWTKSKESILKVLHKHISISLNKQKDSRLKTQKILQKEWSRDKHWFLVVFIVGEQIHRLKCMQSNHGLFSMDFSYGKQSEYQEKTFDEVFIHKTSFSSSSQITIKNNIVCHFLIYWLFPVRKIHWKQTHSR